MRRPALVLLGFLMWFGATTTKAQTPGAASKPATGAPNSSVAPKPIHLPLFFEANRGQADSQVRFVARGKGYTLLLTPTETILAESKTQVSTQGKAFAPFQSPLVTTKRSGESAIRMQLVGANAASVMTGLEELPGKVNYLIGNDPSKWQTEVPLYSQARTEQVYPGVDLLFHGNERQLEYDFVVAPGADPSKIAFRIRGAARMKINAHGDLVLHGTDCDFVMHKPVIYQTIAAERRPIEGSFVKKGKNGVAFRLGAYDHSQELVIDPAIGYASFLGGSGDELTDGFAVDQSTGKPVLYLAGFTTDSTTFPEPNPTVIGSGTAAGEVGFAAKIDPTATGAASLIYLTFIGGKTPFQAADKTCLNALIWLSLDKTQAASGVQPVLGGQTSCSDYPTTTVIQTVTAPINEDIGTVVTRLTAAGNAVDKSALLGGNERVTGSFVSVGKGGEVVLAGATTATNLPVQNAYVSIINNGNEGQGDCFVARLERSDLKPTYLTYMNVGGGSTANNESGCGAFDDSSGNILAGGNTVSATAFTFNGVNLANGFEPNFPTGGTEVTWAAKLNPNLSGTSQLTFATFFGGGGTTRAANGSFDLGNGVVAIVGGTTSNTAAGDIPLKNAFQTQNKATGNGEVGYLALLNTGQTGAASLLCGTYFGGSGGGDIIDAVSYDAGDPTNFRIIIGGRTISPTDFPTMNPIQPYVGAVVGGMQSPDGFVSVLSVPTPTQTPFNATLVFSTYIGGSNPPASIPGQSGPMLFEDDEIRSVGVDANHKIYAVGGTNSPQGFFANTNPATTVNGFQTTCTSCGTTIPVDDGVIFSIGTGASATLQSVAVMPTSASIAVGQTQQFSAVGNYSDGTEKDITSLVTWTTVPTGFATMSTTSPGLATGTAAGMTQVTPALGTATVLNTGALTVTGGTPITLQVKTAGTAFGTITDNLGQINCTQGVGANPSGNCTTQYPSGTQVTLTATTPGTGAFVGAPTVCTGTGNTCQFTITATETVTATFTPGPGTFPLTVVAGTPHTGGGTITSSPTGINCTLTGTTTSGTCTQFFPAGTLLTLTSAPGPGSNFFGWTGTTPNCLASSSVSCLVNMSAATTATVEFTSGGGTVNVTVTGAGNVKDTANAGEINCTNTAGGTQTGTCTAGYTLGTGVTLTETPAAGATFSGWTGASCTNPTAATCSFQVINTTPIAVAATFTPAGGAAKHFSVTAPGTVTVGTTFNITVTALTATNTVATGYTGTIHFTSSDGKAVLPANSALANGTGTLQAVLNTAGAQTITATDTVTASITGTSGTVTVTGVGPGPTLTISKTHTGNFTQGQQGAQYSLTVANAGSGPTTGGQSGSVIVQSTGSIYNTGAGSTPPTMIALPSGATTVVFSGVTGSITTGCASTEGCIILNHGTGDTPNDPDGVGAVPATSSNTGTSSISGIVAPGAGYLVGLFVPAGGPTGTAPTALDFTSSGLGTAFTSLSPQIDQVFFIGDGLTGNDTGTQQTFNVPTGVGQLWLGISDAPGYVGAPGAYGDNLGVYSVNFAFNASGSGGVTVTETAPDGLTLVSMAGTDWTCGSPNAANVCTRSDALAGGASYPVITATVNVAANATSPQVNMAGVTGGGSAPANASDSTVIETAAGTVQLTVQTAGTGTGTVTGNGINCTSGSANGCIVSLPAGTQVVMTQAVTNGSTFAGWNGAPTSCTVAGATCTFTMPATAETVTATFTAAAATLKSIAVTPANPTEPINSSVQFTATGTFSDNSTKDITTTVAWASSNTAAATINAAGLATVGGTAGQTTTISATLNEVTGSTLLTVSNSPISISVTPPADGVFPPVPPGGTLAIGIVLTSTPGFSGTVTFGCTTSSVTITCAPDPATVTLTPTGPTDVAIVLNTFCKGVTTGSVPIPGGFGGGTTLLLLSLTLGGVLWMWRRSPRWAVSFAILVLMAIGGASCASPPKGPSGATKPGNYTVTFTATVNGVTTSTPPIPFTVE